MPTNIAVPSVKKGRKRKVSYRNRPEMAHLYNSDKKPIESAKVVEMIMASDNTDEDLPDPETQQISEEVDPEVYVAFCITQKSSTDYSSRSKETGYGLTSMFYNYRIPGTGEEKW